MGSNNPYGRTYKTMGLKEEKQFKSFNMLHFMEFSSSNSNVNYGSSKYLLI